MLSSKIKKRITQLQLKKYRKEYGEFIVEGVKGVDEAIGSHFEVSCVVIEEARKDEKDIRHISKKALDNHIIIELCGNKDIGEIKTTDTFPGVLAVVSQPKVSPKNFVKGPIIALDGVQDPGNLGTIIRTADWFGVKNILLSEGTVDVYNSKVVRSTMGSVFHMNIRESKSFILELQDLKKDLYKVYALDLEGEYIEKLEANPKAVYILGSESHGVRAELDTLIDKRYTIPGNGQAESLNVAVAAGILMNRLCQK